MEMIMDKKAYLELSPVIYNVYMTKNAGIAGGIKGLRNAKSIINAPKWTLNKPLLKRYFERTDKWNKMLSGMKKERFNKSWEVSRIPAEAYYVGSPRLAEISGLHSSIKELVNKIERAEKIRPSLQYLLPPEGREVKFEDRYRQFARNKVNSLGLIGKLLYKVV